MPASRTQQSATAERRARAMSLRASGATLDLIQQTLGYSGRAAVSKDLSRAMAQAVADQKQSADELRALELMRLDRMQRGLWAAAAGGDPRTAETVLKIIDRRCRMLGLDSVPRGSDTARSILGELAAGLQVAHDALTAEGTYQPPSDGPAD